MAWVKNAKVVVSHRGFRPENWSTFVDHNSNVIDRRYKIASSEKSLVHRASEILGEELNLDKYLLSHCSLVASVDTSEVQNVKLGMVQGEYGRPINRMWNNYRITPETQGYINSNCFIPGTLVTMSDGSVKPIEQIQVGEEVITHLGRTRKVIRTMVNEVDEDIFEIRSRGTTDRIQCTKEHPFFVFRKHICPTCGLNPHRNSKYNFRCATHLLGKVYCSRECSKNGDKSFFIRSKSGEFIQAKDLDRNDFSATPVLQEIREVPLTEGKARLIGYFLSEGYYELCSRTQGEWKRRGVCFAFSEVETETLAKNVVDLLKSEFGATAIIRKHSNDNGIHVTSKVNLELVKFFRHWVKGEGSKTKTLHKDLLYAPLNIQKEILRGWFEGDGCLHQNVGYNKDCRLSGASSSRSMINQLQTILFRLGISSYVTISENFGRTRTNNDGRIKILPDPSKKTFAWNLSCGMGWISDLVKTTKYQERFDQFLTNRKIQNVSKFRFFNGYHLQIFDTINTKQYKGPVYNLEVEEDHSYLVHGIATHNCDSWDRPVLLASYQTLIGAFNFQEHLQIAEHSKGKIIDAVARDTGPSVYVDILVATNRKHAQLIQDIESGNLSTLSMGCFLAGSKVVLADGTRKNIEEILPGEKVITHKGNTREVSNIQIRTYKGELRHIKADFINLIQATANHGFEVQDKGKVRADELQVGDWLCGQKRTHLETGETIPNQSFHQITSIETSHYEGPVYNMEVEEDHTYLVEGVAVYNCTVSHTQCTKCGNVAVDETDICDCQKYQRGNTFIDEQGNLQKVAELCGNKDLDHPTKGVKFIEASWVKVPAFTGAVMRNIVKPEVININTKKQAQEILSRPPKQWIKEEGVRSKAAFDFGDMGGDEGGDQAEEKPQEPKKSPLDELEDETETYILDNVKKRIQDKLRKKNQEEAATGELAVSSNDNVQKTAAIKVAYEREVNVLLKIAKNDADFMNNLSIINGDYGINIDRDIYRSALQAGSTAKFAKSSSYIQECERWMGRKVNRKEAHSLVCLGQILSKLEKGS